MPHCHFPFVKEGGFGCFPQDCIFFFFNVSVETLMQLLSEEFPATLVIRAPGSWLATICIHVLINTAVNYNIVTTYSYCCFSLGILS